MMNVNILSFNFDYIIFGVVVAGLYMIYSLVIKPTKRKKNIESMFEDVLLEYNYSFKKVKGENYDYLLEGKENSKYKRILIRVIEVPKVSSITVNSKNTWNLQYGGSDTPGKGFPYHRYLDEIVPFLNRELEKDELKLILVYKSTLKIQKYQNESELKLLKYADLVYDYKIITFVDFKNHFKDL